MTIAGFRQLPGWFWAVWVAHLVAYALPAFAGAGGDAGSGFECARAVLELWGDLAKALLDGRVGNLRELMPALMLGWFNVINLVAVTAPLLLGFSRRPRWAMTAALVCATGVVHALGFWLGALSGGLLGEGIQPVKVGFFVWWLSYGGLAVAAWREAQRRRIALRGALTKLSSA